VFREMTARARADILHQRLSPSRADDAPRVLVVDRDQVPSVGARSRRAG
jgi:hypothetical protein